MKRLIYAAVIVFYGLVLPKVYALELIMEDHYAPFTYVEAGVAKGSYVDVIRKAMAIMGEDIPIKAYPFARGMEMLKSKSNIAMFALVLTPEREALFKWACPVGFDATWIVKHVRAETPSFSNLEKLAESGQKLGVINGWAAHQYLIKKKFEQLDVAYNMDMLLKKFTNRRSDYIVIGANDLEAQEGVGLDKGIAVPMFKLYDTKKCLAFSLDVSDATVRKWQQALDKVFSTK